MLKKLPIIICAFLFFAILPKSAAASVFYLSPGSGTIANGGTSYIQVRVNTQGDSLNAVSAYLNYPADKVQVVGLSFGSSFSIAAEGAYGSGFVHISRGNFSGVSGDVNIATISVRGLVLGSSATFSFAGGSHAARATDSKDSLNLGGSTGGTYTIVLAPTPTPKDIQPPLLTNIAISNVGTNSATVVWQTDKSSDSSVEYGLDKDHYFLSLLDPTLTTQHTMTLSGQFLVPGTLSHIRLLSKDKLGNVGTSDDQTFQLVGYAVQIKVTDLAGNPLPKIAVTLFSNPMQATTDDKGIALFNNVSPGNHVAVAKFGDIDKALPIAVIESNTPQEFSISGRISPQTNNITSSLPVEWIVAGVICILVIISLVIFLIRKKKQTEPTIATPEPQRQQPTISIQTNEQQPQQQS